MNPFDSVWNFIGWIVLIVVAADVLGDVVVRCITAWRRGEE